MNVEDTGYEAVMSRARRLEVQRQAGTLRLPARAPTGATINASVAFRPKRQGRPVLLQELDGLTWKTVATGEENFRGRARHAVHCFTRRSQ